MNSKKINSKTANGKSLSVSHETQYFWEKTEDLMKNSIPCYIKNILLFNGHRNVQTIKDITEIDLSEMEEYSQRLPSILEQVLTSGKRKNVIESKKELFELFFGIYSNGVGFKFPPGDRKLIILIAKMVSKKLAEENAFFQLSSVSEIDDRQLMPTPVGNLFSDVCDDRFPEATAKRDESDLSDGESVSTDTRQEFPCKERLSLLAKYLETSLRNKFTKKKMELTPQNMNEQPDEITVDYDSMVSLLESTGTIPSQALQPNGGRKSASATIKCVCTNPATDIRVNFTFKKETKDTIILILKKNTGEITQDAVITENFEKNWSLSNYISHWKKAHTSSTSDMEAVNMMNVPLNSIFSTSSIQILRIENLGSDSMNVNDTHIDDANSTTTPKEQIEKIGIVPFNLENQEIRAELILSWLIDQKFDRSMLEKSGMLSDTIVTDAVAKLRQDRNQSKLRRLVEQDLKLIEQFISPQVFMILQNIRKKSTNGTILKYSCVECNVIFKQTDRAWSCERCLLFFHEICKQSYPKESSAEQKFCVICYTR